MADVTAAAQFTFPQVVDGLALAEGEGLYHPFLPDGVRNPLFVGGESRVLFLTGPNMAGKTTYLRTCGITFFLAHLGMGVPARTFRFTPCEALFTAISLSDDTRAGISFFQAEALRARAIAEALAGGHHIVAILDEPFKGTNVRDALDASCAVFSRFAEMKGSLFLIASHLIEAGAVLEPAGSVLCHRFEATDDGGALRFDYMLKPGLSTQRLGMRVLEEHRVLDLLSQASALKRG
jgi:DNA mismatch repair protein MutS